VKQMAPLSTTRGHIYKLYKKRSSVPVPEMTNYVSRGTLSNCSLTL